MIAIDDALRRHRDLLVLATILVLTAIVLFAARTTGHWWGDDWALYVRQAESLVRGGVDAVIDDNRFTVDNSPGTEFSPPLYPWGFPLILAPFVAVLGTDLDRLMIAEVVCYLWFLAMWYLLARPRVGQALGLVSVVVLALSPQYVRWSELIQSELPFMAVALTALVVLDRERVRRSMVRAGEPLWPLALAGVAAAAAFTVRREGLAMVPAVGVAQLAALGAWWWPAWRTEGRRALAGISWPRLIGRLATPHLAWLAVIGAVQVLLPSTLVPSYNGTSITNTWRFASDHLGHVAESLGLKDVPNETPEVLGNALLGWLAVAVFVVLLVGGVALAVWKRPVADLPIVTYLVAVFMIGGSFRYPGTRYVATVGPIALIFAAAALRTVATRVGGARRGVVAAASIVGLLALGNAVRAQDLVSSAREFEDRGWVEWGPDAPQSVQMFDAVDRLTEPDAVVGFFKARAMTLETDRRSLQIGANRSVEAAADLLDYVVLESGDAQMAIVDALPDRYDDIWTNGRFTLYRLRN